MYQKTKTIYKEFDPIMVKLNPILLPPSALIASLWLWSLLFGGSKLVHMFGQQQELIAGPLKVRNPGFIS